MPISELRLIKHVLEFQPVENIKKVPSRTRGIYALYNQNDEGFYNLVYIGMARGEKSGIRRRLAMHYRRKRDLWTHFSMFEVWDNIREDEIEELEGLFRHLFRFDATANQLNKQKEYKKLARLRKQTANSWKKAKPNA